MSNENGFTMSMETQRFKLTGTADILGSIALDREVYSEYIKEKAKTIEEKLRAEADTESVPDMPEEKITGFYRDPVSGNLILKGYQIKGFLKAAGGVLKEQLGLKQVDSKIDKFVFIEEANIPITMGGSNVEKADGYLERPLRVMTMQGPRVSLAKSEKISAGWEVEFTVSVLTNSKTKTSAAITMETVEAMLSYGKYNGLLQWRNAGYGAFTYERVDGGVTE